MEAEQKTRYRNRAEGLIGVCIFDEEGKQAGVAVKPGQTVELTERERRMTANAPEDPDDNPFLGLGPGDPPTAALVPDTDDERPAPVGAPVAPAGEAEQGSYDEGEEVGAPEAPAATKPRGSGDGRRKKD